MARNNAFTEEPEIAKAIILKRRFRARSSERSARYLTRRKLKGL